MIDFADFKQQYIDEHLPKFYAGEMDSDVTHIVANMNSDECREFKVAALDMYVNSQWVVMDRLLEKLAIEYLASEAQDEYRNMIAKYEDDAGEDEAFYQMNR